MRKINSIIRTAFVSEAGSELENNDYFGFVELDEYACYVIADGITDIRDSESARLAIQSIIIKFQEKPSIKKKYIKKYLKAANEALLKAKSKTKLRASITVVITDYVKMRYGYTGNTKLQMYRGGFLKITTQDQSLSYDMYKEEKITKDKIATHEERNNLYCYAGIKTGFKPVISKKIKLIDTDVITMYTRGICENIDETEMTEVFAEMQEEIEETIDNIEDILLSRQPEKLDNYTIAIISIDKTYKDPSKKRKIKQVIMTAIPIIIVVGTISVIIWVMYQKKQQNIEDMNVHYSNTIEYIQDSNFISAKKECEAANELAVKLKDKTMRAELENHQKLIESIIMGDDYLNKANYQNAQNSYVNAKDRTRYSDNLAIEYINEKLSQTKDYMGVYDYIYLGDALVKTGDYKKAEEKYLEARNMASRVYFDKGRQQAIDSLDKLYEMTKKADETTNTEQKDKAETEITAADMIKQGDLAFADNDLDGARVYYTIAKEKYTKLNDEIQTAFIEDKMVAVEQKQIQNEENLITAKSCEESAKALYEEKNYLQAKKMYLLAKDTYKQLKQDTKVQEMTTLIELIDIDIAGEKEKLEKEEKIKAEEDKKKAEEEKKEAAEKAEAEEKAKQEEEKKKAEEKAKEEEEAKKEEDKKNDEEGNKD